MTLNGLPQSRETLKLYFDPFCGVGAPLQHCLIHSLGFLDGASPVQVGVLKECPLV